VFKSEERNIKTNMLQLEPETLAS